MVCESKKADSRSRAIDSSLVLLARILDGAGRPVRATDVVTVRCSIRELGSPEPDIEFNVNPSEIILPELMMSESWTVDDVGYNFRHDLTNVTDFVNAIAPEFGGRVEVRYVFELIDCMWATVSFQLKLV